MAGRRSPRYPRSRLGPAPTGHRGVSARAGSEPFSVMPGPQGHPGASWSNWYSAPRLACMARSLSACARFHLACVSSRRVAYDLRACCSPYPLGQLFELPPARHGSSGAKSPCNRSSWAPSMSSLASVPSTFASPACSRDVEGHAGASLGPQGRGARGTRATGTGPRPGSGQILVASNGLGKGRPHALEAGYGLLGAHVPLLI